MALEEGAFFVLEMDWSTSGAQGFPFGMVVVEKDTIHAALEGASTLYIGGPMDGQIVGFRTR